SSHRCSHDRRANTCLASQIGAIRHYLGGYLQADGIGSAKETFRFAVQPGSQIRPWVRSINVLVAQQASAADKRILSCAGPESHGWGRISIQLEA
ncbi:MAG: hypothetical protein ABF370_07150, partial [Verrucomicrobiales bacterium]